MILQIKLPREGRVLAWWDDGAGEIVALGSDDGPYMLRGDVAPCGRAPFRVGHDAARGVRLLEPSAIRFKALAQAAAKELRRGVPVEFALSSEPIPL